MSRADQHAGTHAAAGRPYLCAVGEEEASRCQEDALPGRPRAPQLHHRCLRASLRPHLENRWSVLSHLSSLNNHTCHLKMLTTKLIQEFPS